MSFRLSKDIFSFELNHANTIISHHPAMTDVSMRRVLVGHDQDVFTRGSLLASRMVDAPREEGKTNENKRCVTVSIVCRCRSQSI